MKQILKFGILRRHLYSISLSLAAGISDAARAILSRIWIVGVIPLLIGLALIFNGTVVSRRGRKQAGHLTDVDPNSIRAQNTEEYRSPADTNQLGSAIPHSIVDETTRNLDA